jgi:leucyl aminopeptidase
MLLCLEWRGGKEGDKFVSLVGKGVTFDTGGLNLKPTSGIANMHMDKHGACSVLSAFESAVKLKLPLNLVAVVGLAENYVSNNSYRPLDIIQSRKGLTVEIGNTDAEGRLVLADCMHWAQEKYPTQTLIELSTLTGAIVVALGKERAGLFTNASSLAAELSKRGEEAD